MAASTITRDTWTNDTGSAAVPAADGTILNNSVLQNHIYARIDAMFAGAGAYATFTLGGALSVEGFGSHLFSAGGSGVNQIVVRNTTAGTGNYCAALVLNDISDIAGLYCFSSTFTTSGSNIASGTLLRGSGVGGVSIAATDAAGAVRVYTGSGTLRTTFNAAGQVLIGDTTNADVTVGLTLNQGANSDQILALKSSSVAHALGVTETDTYGAFSKADGNLGGLAITAYSEAAALSSVFRVLAQAAAGSGDTTKGVGAVGYLALQAYENSAAPGANENLLVVTSGNTTRFILDSDGDSHQDVGTAWTNFDDHEDADLLTALSAGVSRKGDPLRRAFGGLLKKHKATLEQNRIVTFNKDGHHFVNWSRLNMLKVGAIRQNAMRLAAQAAQITALQQRLLALEGAR